ncbi:MAG: hypothetical protein K2G21_07450 [Muribaculaceae bacterium]|nr:hypothetical protein [Muribaculaceae bacterium]
MKKLFYLFLALPLLFVSCDDDNDLPNVEIYATFEGGTQVDDVYYVVQGQELQVTEVTLVNHDEKEASLGGVRYFWDYMPIGTTILKPYAINIPTEEMPVGNHLLQAEMPIYAVGYSICTGYIAKKITIVAEEEDIPVVDTPSDSKTQANIQAGDADK